MPKGMAVTRRETEELETRECMAEGWQGNPETEIGDGIREAFKRQTHRN